MYRDLQEVLINRTTGHKPDKKMKGMMKMTGKEFLEKVRAIKTITDLHWEIKGDACDPDLVKVSVIADGEQIEVTYPNPYTDFSLNHYASIAFLVNKLMEQMGCNSTICAFDDLTAAVNHSRELIKERQG